MYNYWAPNSRPKLSLNENVFRIDDLLTLFGDNDKIVFVVEGIVERQPKFTVVAYDAIKDKFGSADKGNTYYYVFEKASLTRKTSSELDPDGIMYAKTANGEPVMHLSVTMGTNNKNNQTWYYLFLDAVRFDESGLDFLQLRGEPPGSGDKIPPDTN